MNTWGVLKMENQTMCVNPKMVDLDDLGVSHDLNRCIIICYILDGIHFKATPCSKRSRSLGGEGV